MNSASDNYDPIQEKYSGYIQTGGFSRPMITLYLIALVLSLSFLWFILPPRLALAVILFLLGLPFIFYYRLCQYSMQLFGPVNTPMIWWHWPIVRPVLLILGFSLLATSLLLSYSAFDSIATTVVILLVTLWTINALVKHHMQVTIEAMRERRKTTERIL
jgi:hypothetical protein